MSARTHTDLSNKKSSSSQKLPTRRSVQCATTESAKWSSTHARTAVFVSTASAPSFHVLYVEHPSNNSARSEKRRHKNYHSSSPHTFPPLSHTSLTSSTACSASHDPISPHFTHLTQISPHFTHLTHFHPFSPTFTNLVTRAGFPVLTNISPHFATFHHIPPQFHTFSHISHIFTRFRPNLPTLPKFTLL